MIGRTNCISSAGSEPVIGQFRFTDPGVGLSVLKVFVVGQTWRKWMETPLCTIDMRVVGDTVEMNPEGSSGYGWIVYDKSDSHNVKPDEEIKANAVYSAFY